MATKSLCSIETCDKTAAKRGWCEAHYRKALKYGDPLGTGRVLPRVHTVCTVPDCSKKHFAHGWCRTHYIRWWDKGTVDLVAGRAASGETEEFLRAHVKFEAIECLEWPFAKITGYGQARVGGVDGPASRLMCQLVHGEPPSPVHQAAHFCGNRGCVNPKHLRWATPAENDHDKIEHGTHNMGESNWNAKLTDEDVRTIRRNALICSASQLSEQFGVSESRIHAIIARIGWTHIE